MKQRIEVLEQESDEEDKDTVFNIFLNGQGLPSGYEDVEVAWSHAGTLKRAIKGTVETELKRL